MDWQTILLYIAGAMLALAAIKLAFEATIYGWSMAGVAATTAAVALQIAPGLFIGDRALVQMMNAPGSEDARKIDAYRERARRDIVARAIMFPRYPNHLARVQNALRS